MKNRTNYLTKIFILLIGISLFLVNCQKEEINTEQNLEQDPKTGFPYEVKTKKYFDLKNDYKFKDALRKFTKNKNTTSSALARSAMEDEYGFTIDSTEIKEITTDEYTTYTFFIYKDSIVSEEYYENLVLKVDNTNETTAYIIKYTLNSESLDVPEDESKTLDATIEVFEIDYINSELKFSSDCVGVPMCPWGDGPDHIAGQKCFDATRTGDDAIYLDTSMCGGSGGGDNTGTTGGTDDDGNTGTGSTGGTTDGCDTCGAGGTSGNSGDSTGDGSGTTTSPVTGSPEYLREKSFKLQLKNLGLLSSYSELSPEIQTQIIAYLEQQFQNQDQTVEAYPQEAINLMVQVINIAMANTGLSFEDAFAEIIWDELNLFPDISGDQITDIIQYLNCFDLNQPAELTVYVDQPKPNSDSPYRILLLDMDVDVGHTFISIKQGSITRVLGYYPIPNTINPSNDPAQNVISCTSILRNDSNHEFDVSISININSTQLTNIYNAIISSNPTYNLNSYNCTDFGIDISNEAGLNLPDTNGTWPRGGNGSNPGNLGQDIRNMPTPTGATKNESGGTSLSNTGSC